LQSDMTVQKWCLDNGVELNVGKTTFISVTCKTNSIAFMYKLGFTHIACSLHVEDLWVLLDSKLHFHNHVDHAVAQTVKC
jgi:hypothetical protein